ncbi:MAG: glycosyltransferase family 4 protein [Holophagales bacterium]|nr:glycosyltransferase family 4 protein [Holophagales bacterium]MYG31946.1 glycosyltransferase family 4 protein [Holophagales bacterium]MYI79017.1 glycosyltransferase family 4 protein [Holophagales bacterium]
MKVLLVANVLPPRDLSGAGEQVLQLAWGLSEAGCEVEVLGRDRCGPNVSKGAFPWRARSAVHRVVREWRPDVVQVHESDGGLVIRDLARLDGPSRPLLVALQQVSYVRERQAVRPLVDHDQDAKVVARPVQSELLFRSLRTPLHIALGRLTARRSDVRLAPSRVTALEIEQDYGVEGVRVVPNVTGAPLGARTPESAQVADRDEEAVDEPYLLAVGRLRIRKGMEILLQALAQVRDRGHRPRLVVAGDGERRETLDALCEQLGLGASVHWAGRCSRSEVARLQRRAAALIVPSTYEGMPLVVLEAMSDGVPVIASAVSGIPEVVVDGQTGWLVPPERSAALADALIDAVSDPDAARVRGEAGRQRLDQRFRPHHAARHWFEAVGSVGFPVPTMWENPPG